MQKKLKSISLMAVTSLLVLNLSGCSVFKSTDNSFDNDRPLDRRIGTIKPLGNVGTSAQGTDILDLGTGDTVLLRSAQINLDDPAYQGKMVEVMGLITHKTDGKELMDVTNIDVVDASPTQQTNLVTWKDFPNGLGVEIQYRSDLDASSSDNQIEFTRDFVPSSSTQQTTSTTQQTSDSMVNSIRHTLKIEKVSSDSVTSYLKLADQQPATLTAAGLTKSKIGSKPYDAFKKDKGDSITYYVQAGSEVFVITLTTAVNGKADEHSVDDRNLFYDMLNQMTFDVITVTPSTQASQN